jgi:hypothetical protein
LVDQAEFTRALNYAGPSGEPKFVVDQCQAGFDRGFRDVKLLTGHTPSELVRQQCQDGSHTFS